MKEEAQEGAGQGKINGSFKKVKGKENVP